MVFIILGILNFSCINKFKNQENVETNKNLNDTISRVNEELSVFDGIYNLNKSFEDNSVSELQKFPEYYGGHYINESDMSLVILITDDNPENYKMEFEERTKFKNIRLIKGNFSYEKLQTMLSEIDQFIRKSNENEVNNNVVSWSIQDIENKILINVLDTSENKIRPIKNLFRNSSAIKFVVTSKERDM